MSWSDAVTPVRMCRVALIAPADSLRDMLIRVARAGVVDLDRVAAAEHSGPEHTGADPLDGEAELRSYVAAAVRRREVAALAGWCPDNEVAPLAHQLEPVGAAVVTLPPPAGIDPPTLLADTHPVQRAFAPLVRIYGIIPYRDIDPTVSAGLAYVTMFGMMFGDVGHGLLLAAVALLLRSGRIRRLASLRPVWPFVAGAGAAAAVFGVLYGEFFGPTGILPVVWLAPLDQPVRLLIAAIAAGAVLLALAYGLGVVNRWREGGFTQALYSSSGIAGAATFLGLGVLAWGVVSGLLGLLVGGAVTAGAGLVLSVIGMFTESGGGATGAVRSGVGVIDLVVHIGSNLVSFARLAAFGMTHAALGWVVWLATTAIAGRGLVGYLLAAVVFIAGNIAAFALEALVAGVQALRLEYYELFSRVFAGEGRPFTPWRIPLEETEELSC
jgi:V/A-type H+-transporting ATPase subunit I